MTPAAQRRRNIVLAWGLFGASVALAASVFAWRLSHNQTAIPQGSAYAQSYYPVQGVR